MALFGKKTEGGLMDVIRCDLEEYLIWKWSPAGVDSRRENAIRYGSSLRVKDGEVAVLVYKQKDGTNQDFIEGPYDQMIKTANLPILTSIVGSAYGGASPFQAEVYFINLSGNIKLTFFITEFPIYDIEQNRSTLNVTAKGTLIFNIKDYQSFIKLNRMIAFELDRFQDKIRGTVTATVRDIITDAPVQTSTRSWEIPRARRWINKTSEEELRRELERTYGINVDRFDITDIEFVKDDSYRKLMAEIDEAQAASIRAQKAETELGVKNKQDLQSIYAENEAENLRVMREETQRAQRLSTETSHLTAHQIDVQGDVAKTAAASLGELGGSGGASMGDGSGGGMNPAAMMTGMMMGGAIGGGMSNMMGNMMNNLNQPVQQPGQPAQGQPQAGPAGPPPPPPQAMVQYHITINGQQAGPYTIDQLGQMISCGQIQRDTFVWKTGMANWDQAANMAELGAFFNNVPPPPPVGL